jgi:hypothetical protein
MCFDDFPVSADPERNASRVVVGRNVAGAVRNTELALGVRQKREGEVVLLGEAALGVDIIEAAAEDHRIEFREFVVEVPEPGTLLRSARCVGHRIEPQHDVSSSVVAQPNGLAAMILYFEVRCSIAWFRHPKLSSRQPLADHPEHAANLHRSE